ncbi:hypothetical protein M0R45_009130 [Rubus argutus]|uniref:Uncharacterized protein n=1 Tax=Rubus argutus TaxID=59490 RepID=A0AAW1Y4Z0_RUBAR
MSQRVHCNHQLPLSSSHLHYKAEPSWDFCRRCFQFITVVAHPARTPSPPIIYVSKLLSLVHGAIGNPAVAASLSSHELITAAIKPRPDRPAFQRAVDPISSAADCRSSSAI